MISAEELAQMMVAFGDDARLIERLTAITEAAGHLVEQVGVVIDLDPELGPEAGAIAEHLLESSRAAQRAAIFVSERQRARHAKLGEEI